MDTVADDAPAATSDVYYQQIFLLPPRISAQGLT
jgi:hypothetical protein